MPHTLAQLFRALPRMRVSHASTTSGPAQVGPSSRGGRRTRLCAAILGVVTSISYYGSKYVTALSDSSAADQLPYIAGANAIAALVFGFVAWLLLRRFQTMPKAHDARIKWLLEDRRGIILMALALLVVWMPWIWAMYPFNVGPDTVAQLIWSQGGVAFDPSMREVLPGYAMSDHHPFLLTYVYGFFYDLGKGTSNVEFGLTLLCWLQTAVMSAVFAYACHWMHARRVPAPVCVGALVFWGLVPAVPMLLQQIVKDMSSLPFYLLFLMLYIDVALEVRGGRQVGVPRVVGLAITAVLGALCRKIFLYIAAGSLAVLAIFALVWRMRSHRGGLTAPVILAGVGVGSFLLVSVIIPAMLFGPLRIAPGGPQETLAIPIQQVSAVVIRHGDELSEEDRAVIDRVLPLDELPDRFDYASADPVKDAWKRDSTNADRKAFLALWIKLAFRHPISCLDATRYLSRYWVIGDISNDGAMTWWGWEEMGSEVLFPDYQRATPTPRQSAADLFSRVYVMSVPVVRLLGYTAFYQLWVPAFALCLNRIVGRRNLVLFVPVVLSILTVLVTPAFLPRYAFMQMFAAPIIIAIAYLAVREGSVTETCVKSTTEKS